MLDVQSYSELNAYFWLKIAFTFATIICGVACLPRIYKHRQHPVLKYRTFPLYMMTYAAGFELQFSLIFLSTPIEYTATGYLVLCLFDGLALAGVFGLFAGIGLRYYSLVLTRYIQGQLMDRRTCMDGVFYRRVVSQIRWTRYMTFEQTAIKISAILFVFYFALFATLYYLCSDHFTQRIMRHASSLFVFIIAVIFVVMSLLFLGIFVQILLETTAFDAILLTIKLSVFHVALGVVLAVVYPGERPDNFFVYEQFLVSLIWNSLNFTLFLLQEIYDDQTKQVLSATQHISQSLLIMFELTLPLYIIQKYGYPDVDTEKKSPSNGSISPDRPNQSETTGDSAIYTVRSQLGIDEIMGDKHFRKLFSHYLGRDFQFEAFLFFEAIHYHKDAIEENANSVQLLTKEDAQRIIDEFIADDAVNKLPISDRLCKQILDDFSKLDDENPVDIVSIFEPAIDNLKTRLSFLIYKFNLNM